MAPNLAVSRHELTQNIINSKLQGDQGPTDNQTANIASCSSCTIRRHRRNVLYGSTKVPPNGAGRPKTITPPMLTALRDKLAIIPCMHLEDMATFLRGEFEVEVSRFSISRALRGVKWSKKNTYNIAQERNADLRDEYIHDVSAYRSEQLVFIDESGVDKSIPTLEISGELLRVQHRLTLDRSNRSIEVFSLEKVNVLEPGKWVKESIDLKR